MSIQVQLNTKKVSSKETVFDYINGIRFVSGTPCDDLTGLDCTEIINLLAEDKLEYVAGDEGKLGGQNIAGTVATETTPIEYDCIATWNRRVRSFTIKNTGTESIEIVEENSTFEGYPVAANSSFSWEFDIPVKKLYIKLKSGTTCTFKLAVK